MSSFSIFNPSGSFPASYPLDWLRKASPCPQQGQFDRGMALGHVRYHEGIAELMNLIHGFAIGVGPKGNPEHRPLRSGWTMAQGAHPSTGSIVGHLSQYR